MIIEYHSKCFLSRKTIQVHHREGKRLSTLKMPNFCLDNGVTLAYFSFSFFFFVREGEKEVLEKGEGYFFGFVKSVREW